MLGKFFKPKWQHNDATVRLKSLANLAGDSPELIKIAQSDPDSDVRMEAITRLHHMPTLVQLGHTAGSIGERARQRVVDLAATDHRHDQLLTEVFAWLQNPSLLRSIARDSVRSVKLRRHAIATLNDQELLFWIASNDTSKEIQYLAAAQLHDLAQLQALEKMHGKNNKRLRQLLKEREATLQQQQKQQADIEALCNEVKSLGNNQRWAQEKTRARVLEQRWQKLSKIASETQQQCFQQALSDFQQALQAWEHAHTQQQQLQAQQAAEQARLTAEIQQQAEAAAQAERERLEQAQQREAAIRKQRQQQQAQQEQALNDLHNRLKTLEAQLEAEQYGDAIETHKTLREALKQTTHIPAKDHAFFQRRLQALAPFLREIQDWRRWGTDQVRKQLIETAEHLRTDAALDPQERAKKIHSLREEWRKLSQLEPRQQHTLWKAFDSNATAAYELSKHYFAEQAQQRAVHLEQRQAICAQLEALHADTDWKNPDWRALQVALNDARKHWKSAGTVGHKDWKGVNDRFNAAVDALEMHIKAERARNWQERNQLVEQAKALLDAPDTARAIEQAKRLQGQWQISISSRPADEQRLWKQFREPIDTLFARAREARKLQQQAYEAQLAETARQTEEERRRRHANQQQQLASLEALATESAQRKQADTSAEAQMENRNAGELLCLQLEILLALESPPEFQPARLKYQVMQLSETMRNRKDTVSPTAQALPVLKQWYALGGMPATALASQTARIEKIKQALVQEWAQALP